MRCVLGKFKLIQTYNSFLKVSTSRCHRRGVDSKSDFTIRFEKSFCLFSLLLQQNIHQESAIFYEEKEKKEEKIPPEKFLIKLLYNKITFGFFIETRNKISLMLVFIFGRISFFSTKLKGKFKIRKN